MSATLAATVVALRDGETGSGPLEVLLVRRTSAVAFGGNWVFPGGRADPGDAEPAGVDGSRSAQRAEPAARLEELAIARRAAAREMREESSLVVVPDDLVPVSLWLPPAEAPRRYRTWYFAVAAPRATVAVDGAEIVDHAWMTPSEALARHEAGTVELAPPTWMTLWRVGREWGTTVHEVLRRLEARVPDRFETRMVAHGARLHAVWEGDAAYAGGDLDAPGPRRRLAVGPVPWSVQWDPPGDGQPAIMPS